MNIILLNEKGEWATPIEKKSTPEQVDEKIEELKELVKSLTSNK